MLSLVDSLRAALLLRNAKELERITRAYYDTVFLETEADREALQALIQQEDMTAEKLASTAVYKRAVSAVDTALAAYGSYLLVELRSVTGEGTASGLVDAERLVEFGINLFNSPAVARSVPLDAALQALNLLSPDGELYKRLQVYGEFNAAQIAQGVIDAVVLGKNPKVAAAELVRLYGVPLNDALRLTRTAQLYSYRRATHVNYAANADIVPGWIWYAKLDGDTCASCWSQHGTYHGHDEELNDHHSGRCTPLPAVFGFNPVNVSGIEWFENLDETQQTAMLGQGKYQAWKEGKISLDQLSAEHTDDVYGTMRIEATLKSLIEG